MSLSWKIQLMETAKAKELEILQTQYPNRFAYLKSDLESFISNLRLDHAPSLISSTSSSVVLTQESSNCKNYKKQEKKRNLGEETLSSSSSSSTGKIHKSKKEMVTTKRKDRVEIVLERAHLCLQKIRDVKASLS